MKTAQRNSVAGSRTILQQILEGLRAGFLLVDPDNYTVVESNSIVEALIGLPHNSLVGSCCDSYFKGDEFSESECRLCASLEENILNKEDRLEATDGTIIPVRFSAFPISIKGKTYIAQVLFDITEQKNIERQLAHAQKMESIGLLAAGIAHEINTPTQYIGDNLRFLQNSFAEIIPLLGTSADSSGDQSGTPSPDIPFLVEEIPNSIQQALDGIEHISTIVLAMKKFSHPDGTQKTFFNVNQAIGNIATVTRNEWKYVARLETDLSHDIPEIKCHPSDINQVILNILVNAAQAIGEKIPKGSSEKGTIRIQTHKKAGPREGVVIRISDTGIGIPESLHDKIFNPFFTTKEIGKGTGQGLAISHDIIVHKHGGSISFTSTPGAGTTFTIELPIDPPAKQDAHAR